MPITIDTAQYCSNASNCGPYDHMETFIDIESNEGCVVFASGHTTREVCYESDSLTPEQWSQIVQLDREIALVMNGYINRAIKILEIQQKVLAAR